MPDVQAFRIDTNGRIALTEDVNGNIDFEMVDDIDCVEQDIIIRLRTTLGEDILHPEVGLPFQRIWNGTNAYLADRINIAVGLDDDIATVFSVRAGSDVDPDFVPEGGGRTRGIPVDVVAISTDAQEVTITEEL